MKTAAPVGWTPESIPQEWRELLQGVPGYDPVETRGDSWFEPKLAKRIIDFFHECLQHVEGALAGQPFRLERWQQAVVANLFGWVRKDAHGRVVRRYRETMIYVPRKNGKSPLAAGIALYCLLCDAEAGAQVVCAAADQEQAAVVFRHARGMVEQEPELAARVQVYRALKSIVLRDDQAATFKTLSSQANTKHGGNLHAAIIDEVHAHPTRDLVDVLTTSMASANRRQPLTVMITTADYHRESICNEKHDYAGKVRDRIIDDPSFLPVIYETKQNEEWKDPAVWAKSNPNLGVSVSLEYLERECKKAQESPAYENTFRRLHLNQKTETDVRAIPMDRWEACGTPRFDESELRGRECWSGLDLASTTDVAAFALTFPREDGYQLMTRFWVPESGMRQRSRRDRVPYDQWAREGWITATPGDVIDYDRIRRDVVALGKDYNIREIAADRWNATQIIAQLQGDGFEMFAFGQGFASMTAPTKELLKLIAAGKLWHNGNPVLRWMASNLATDEDAAGNLKPSKKKSTEKIDGVVAVIMALGRAMIRDESGTWYTPGCLLD